MSAQHCQNCNSLLAPNAQQCAVCGAIVPAPRRRAWQWLLGGCAGLLVLCLCAASGTAFGYWGVPVISGQSFFPGGTPTARRVVVTKEVIETQVVVETVIVEQIVEVIRTVVVEQVVEVVVTREAAVVQLELVLWHDIESGSDFEAAFLSAVENYEVANPGISIVAEYVDSSSIYDQYLTARAAGVGPDIVMSFMYDSLARDGHMLSLNLYRPGGLYGFLPGAEQAVTMDGVIYALPYSLEGVALYYNTDYLSYPPYTTEEMLYQVQAGNSLVVSLDPYYTFGFFGAFGGQLMDDNGRCIADQGGFLDALEYLVELRDAGALFTDYSTAQSMFENGEAAMWVNGPWAYEALSDALGSSLGVGSLPYGPYGAAAPMVGARVFFINPDSWHIADAYQAIDYFSGYDAAMYFLNAAHFISARDDIYYFTTEQQGFADSLRYGVGLFLRPELGGYWGPFSTMMTEIFTNNANPADALSTACEEMNNYNGK